jgi:hypothetical protein
LFKTLISGNGDSTVDVFLCATEHFVGGEDPGLISMYGPAVLGDTEDVSLAIVETGCL